MIAVFVTFRYGEDFSLEKAHQLAHTWSPKFQAMPGLRSKLFSVLPDLREVRNVYVWDDPNAASSFFTQESRGHIGALYGVQPIIEYAEVSAVIEQRAVRLPAASEP